MVEAIMSSSQHQDTEDESVGWFLCNYLLPLLILSIGTTMTAFNVRANWMPSSKEDNLPMMTAFWPTA
jgi:hypothetical protein